MGVPPKKNEPLSKADTERLSHKGVEHPKKIDLFGISVLNALSAHVAVIDNDGNIIAVNNAWQNFAAENKGDPHAVAVGANYFRACRQAATQDSVQEATTAIEGIKSVLSAEAAEFELEYTCHSPDEKRWFIMRATPMRFMGDKAVISHIDISEKKRVEERLIEREKELTALNIVSRTVNSEISLDGVIQAILSQISATINPDLALLFLKEGEDLHLNGIVPDHNPYSFDTSHVHKVGQCLCGLSVSTETSIFSKEIQEDDRCTWQECKAAGITSFAAIPLRNRDDIIGTLGIASIDTRDFERRRQFLEAMANDVAICLDNTLLYEKAKNYAQDLEVQLYERQKIEKRLQQTQKMEAIGKLAGGIAHDFNNILSPILGFTELVMDDLPKDTMMHQNLSEVFKAGNRAKDLVQQILTFTRQSESELQPIDIAVPVMEAMVLLRSSLPSTIRIIENIPTGLSAIRGDTTQIYQIIMNLCTNAAHAMKESGGTLEVSMEQVLLDSKFIVNYKVLPKGHYIKLIVSDTGVGMATDVLESIFDPYYTTKEKGEGTGLGLTVVQGITKRHGGEINVYSEPLRGTTFTLYFPVIEAHIEHLSDGSEVHPQGSESVLLVDDEIAIVRMGKQVLENFGYHVTATTQAEEALQLFKENSDGFDAVVTDMTMPTLRGDQLAQKITQLRPSVAIVICTGFSRRISEETIAQLNIDSILTKPFSQRELAVAVRKAIDRKVKKI